MTTGSTRGGSAVLEDPTGQRARWLRRGGRIVFLLFLAWLLAIVLSGLGLIPVAPIPLGHALRPSQGPPLLKKLPTPKPPTASDLRPAVTAKVFAAKLRQHGRSVTAPGQAKTSPTSTVTRGKSTTAPGQTKTSPSSTVSRGKSTTAPGQTKTSPSSTVTHGGSTIAPGRNKTTTSTVP